MRNIDLVLEKISIENYHMKSDFRLRCYGELIVLHIEQQEQEEPQMKKALERIEKEIKEKGKCKYLVDWLFVLSQGWVTVKKILTGDDDKSLELRQSIPFHGVMTEDERLEILLISYNKPAETLPTFKKKMNRAIEKAGTIQ